MQKYPIGIQNFKELITGGYVYVDKTEHIYRLATLGKYYFLSRPRRFGKSLLVSTLEALYEGQKELFDGLWIADKWDFTKTNPVIAVYFNMLQLRGNSLDYVLQQSIQNQATELGIVLDDEQYREAKNKSGFLFQELIRKLHVKTGRKVVVLIDEYDKPIVDFLEDLPTAQTNRDILKSFYGILKPADEHLELVLLTGVSKFSKVSIFSDLNNLRDITLNPMFADLVGISQTELESNFKNEIQELADEKNITQPTFLAQIKRWYNGYSWDGKKRVYNPFSLLNFFGDRGNFQNYWFSTGTPTWLVKLAKDAFVYDFSNLVVDEGDLNAFDISNLQPIPLLFQTGYLTIESYSPEDYLYTLNYPNEEVRLSLTQYLLRAFRHNDAESPLPMVVKLRNALQTNDIETAIEVVNTVFASLPYDLWQTENERFYHALIHLTFVLLGVYVQSEVHTARGRCDALVQTTHYVYAFEFKLDKTAQEALAQIETKGYLLPYAQSGKTRVGVGINFSTPQKLVSEWLVKTY